MALSLSPAAPMSNLVVVDRIATARCALGAQIQVALNSIQARNTDGRIAHIRGIVIEAALRFTAGATNDAVSAYMLRALFESIHLEDESGHVFANALDGRDLLDDVFARHGSQWANVLRAGAEAVNPRNYVTPEVTFDNGIAADHGAGATRVNVSTYWPLTNPTSANPLKGLLPLAAFQKNSNAFTFRVRQSLRLPSGAVPDGITLDSTQPFECLDGTPGMRIMLDIVWLPGVYEQRWALDNYTSADASGSLRYVDSGHDYAVVRYRPEDTGTGQSSGAAQLAAADFNVASLSVENEPVIPGLTAGECIARTYREYATRPLSSIAQDNAKLDLPLFDTTGNSPVLLMLFLTGSRHGRGMGHGRVTFNFVGRVATTTRFLHRTTAPYSAAHAAAILKACGETGGTPAIVDETGSATMVETRPTNGRFFAAA